MAHFELCVHFGRGSEAIFYCIFMFLHEFGIFEPKMEPPHHPKMRQNRQKCQNVRKLARKACARIRLDGILEADFGL